jgi:hypothetical protein
MAVLDPTNRARAAAQWMRDNTAVLGALSKADLRAAVDATDDWIDSNAASFNQALPVAARTELTATQKTFLFCYVALRRAGRLRAEEDG